MNKIWSFIWSFSSVLIAALLIAFLIFDQAPWPSSSRDYTEASSVQDTGAINLVSSIYLGYRAYDTLGETIVLLLGVLGTLGILQIRSNNEPTRQIQKRRTEFLKVASGKLGPIVLVFGLYVMLFGHVSPGGGFQGGVVIASGIVFLAMGTREAVYSPLVNGDFLKKLESLTFFLIVLSALLGLIVNVGFFGNIAPMVNIKPVYFIVMLNVLIGLKVGSSLGLLCLVFLWDEAT